MNAVERKSNFNLVSNSMEFENPIKIDGKTYLKDIMEPGTPLANVDIKVIDGDGEYYLLKYMNADEYEEHINKLISFLGLVK